MTSEQLEIVNKCLKGAFGDTAPLATVEGDCIVVGAWSISQEEYDSTAGLTKKPIKTTRFVLDVAMPYYGGREEPPGVDVVEVHKSTALHEVILSLVSEIAQDRAESVLEALRDEAMVAQWEADNALVDEHFSSPP